AVTNPRGEGLFVAGMPTLNVSLVPWRDEVLTKAQHRFELPPREESVLHLDYGQDGLGSHSCGPGPLTRYRLAPKPVSFTVRLRPFTMDAVSPATLHKLVPEVPGILGHRV